MIAQSSISLPEGSSELFCYQVELWALKSPKSKLSSAVGRKKGLNRWSRPSTVLSEARIDVEIGDGFDTSRSRIIHLDSRTFSCIVVGGYSRGSDFGLVLVMDAFTYKGGNDTVLCASRFIVTVDPSTIC